MTQTQQFQKLFDQFVDAFPDNPGADLDACFRWAKENGLYKPDPVDESRVFRRKMADALAKERRIDSKGRSVRAKLPYPAFVGGKQMTLWADIDSMPVEAFQKNVAQRRNQIVGDCVQLSSDVAHYNDQNPDEPDIQLVLDFTDDVEERETMLSLN